MLCRHNITPLLPLLDTDFVSLSSRKLALIQLNLSHGIIDILLPVFTLPTPLLRLLTARVRALDLTLLNLCRLFLLLSLPLVASGGGSRVCGFGLWLGDFQKSGLRRCRNAGCGFGAPFGGGGGLALGGFLGFGGGGGGGRCLLCSLLACLPLTKE